MKMNAYNLLFSKRFLPLFLTQVLQAFNDNFFKNALAILITYTLITSATKAEVLVSIASAIFILPFFLFSATAGQIADKFDKATIIRFIKILEIGAMILASIGFYHHDLRLLLTTLFIMGVHSAFFAPIKYAILPDHLERNELIGANALIESSTFIAILFGTILGTVLINFKVGESIVATLGILTAVLGLFFSFFIPSAKPTASDLKLSFNILNETKKILEYAHENYFIYLSILGISWFWLVGMTLITQFPTFTHNILNAKSSVSTLLFVMFSMGIAIGSLLSNKLQKQEINAKFVPIGILGMTIFLIDLSFAGHHFEHSSSEMIGLGGFLLSFTGWRLIFDTLLLSICGGLYIVPLYTIMQSYSRRSHRARIIAANNIMNAVFMVIAAISNAILLKIGVTIPKLFFLVGFINAGVAIYACKLLPEEFVKSFVAWILKSIYRVKVVGLDNYEKSGKRTIIVANHVSFIDALLLSAFLPDKMIFAVNNHISSQWWFKPIHTLIDVFPIDPTRPMSTKSLINMVKQNHRCIIFPEGRLTTTGGLMKIYEGPGLIADKTNANILPIRIDGAQFTPFSRLKDKVKRQWFPQITLTILAPRKFSVPEEIKGRTRRRYVSSKLYDLMTDMIFESSNLHRTLFTALIDAKKTHGGKHRILEDIERKPQNYKQLIMRSFILGRYIAKNSAPNEFIGILLPNAIAAAVCFFAPYTYGRIPAMLNFSTGVKNILSSCKTANIKTVYTSKRFVDTAKLQDVIEKMSEAGIKIVFLENLRSKISLFDKILGFLQSIFAQSIYSRLNRNAKSCDTAVVLFTSGSEGTPKGVLLSHENILANIFQLTARVDFNSRDIAFNALPVFHCFGLTAGMILPILNGIKTFLYPSPLHYRIIPELIYDSNATITFGTDTFLSGYAKCAHPYDFYSIRYIFAGAEKLKEETRKIWMEKFGIILFEGYGATETAPVISMNTAMHNRNGTVGKFLSKIQFRIEPVKGIHDGGRLFVSGPNIMQGYMFADKPLAVVPPEGGWHDTGDIVDIDNDGYITIKGRAKRFAKIGGEMISLTAVETYASNLWPEMLSVAINLPDEKKGEMILLLTENKNATREDLLSYYKSHGVGEIYLPKKVVYFENIPILPSGKVDYVSLNDVIKENF